MKTKNNIANLKEFGIKDIFEYERGKRYKKVDHIAGNLPYISSTSVNNGIDGYVSLTANLKSYQNCITLANSGSVGSSFYHCYEFVPSDHVHVLWLKNGKSLTKEIALFLITSLQANKSLFNFNKEISNKTIEEIKIMLPENTGGTPDWAAMESFIKSRETPLIERLAYWQKYEKNYKKINVKSWKKFKITDVFDVEKPKKRSIQKYELGKIPYVSSSKYDNGIISSLKPKNEDDIENGKCITINPLDGTSFWQEKNFLARGGGGSSIFFLRNSNLNKYNALFICTILRKRLSVEYNNMANSKTFEKTILLPVSSKSPSEPDWKYMENFIKTKELLCKNKIESVLQ